MEHRTIPSRTEFVPNETTVRSASCVRPCSRIPALSDHIMMIGCHFDECSYRVELLRRFRPQRPHLPLLIIRNSLSVDNSKITAGDIGNDEDSRDFSRCLLASGRTAHWIAGPDPRCERHTKNYLMIFLLVQSPRSISSGLC